MASGESLERDVIGKLTPIRGKTIAKTAEGLGLSTGSPVALAKAAIGERLVDTLVESGRRIHTVSVRDPDLYPWEAVSFPSLQLKTFAEETWETSELARQVHRILFIPVMGQTRDEEGGLRVFGQAFFWSPEPDQLRGIQQEWEMYREGVKAGDAEYKVLRDERGHEKRDSSGHLRRANQLPGMKETTYIHMRPKARDSSDTDEDPLGNEVTRQAFWLNKGFLQEIMKASALDEEAGKADAEMERGQKAVPPQQPAAPEPDLPFGNLATLLRAMRQESPRSVVAAGELPPLNKALYVNDWVDSQIEQFLTDSQARLLVLTGSAGDGKSAAIVVANDKAERLDVNPRVRPDASQSDRSNEDFRPGLRRFLDEWLKAPPGSKFILGMNLGRALDFFTDREETKRYSSLAARFDEEFKLGISERPSQDPDIVLVDIQRRIQPTLTDGSLDIPWIRRFLTRFDSSRENSVVKEAVDHQVKLGLGRHDPLVTNLRLLTMDAVQDRLVMALASAVVRHDAHLTPRRVMDLVSRLVLPAEVEDFLDKEGKWTANGLKAFSDPERWEYRLSSSLFNQLFPENPLESSFDPILAAALHRENPTYDRTAFMDRRILQWSADPTTLSKDIPEWFIEYLGSKEGPSDDEGLRLLIQVAAWTSEQAPTSRRVRRVEDFLKLCQGDRSTQENLMGRLKSGLRHYVTRSFYREWDIDARPQSIAVQVYRFSFNSRLKTVLDEFHLAFTHDGFHESRQNEFGLEVQRGGHEPISLPIDWQSFDLLMDVAAGVNPAAAETGTTVSLNRLQRSLQAASSLTHNLEWTDDEERGTLVMHREGPANRTKVRGEVHE